MNNSIFYLIESGICLVLFYVVYWAFLKTETYFAINRFFLLLAVPISFFIPLIDIPSPFPASYSIETTYALNQPASVQMSYPQIIDIVWLIYLVGAGVFFLHFIYRLIQISVLIKRHGFQKYGRAKIVLIDKNSAPFSFFNFIFINKSNVTDQDLERILEHELVHIKQYHSLDLILLELLTIFQWFNPFVWPYKKSLKETHEYLADNAVIARGCSKAKYQMLIFEQHVGVKLFEFANNFNHSQIKRRITMMERIKSAGRAKLKLLLILPVIALLVLAFSESNPAKEESGKIDADKVMLSQEDSKGTTQTEEQKKKEQKEKQKEILMKEKQLKEEYAKTEDPEKKKLIKKKLMELKKMIEEQRKQAELEAEAYELYEMLEKTEDPEKKKLIKKKLEHLKQLSMKKGSTIHIEEVPVLIPVVIAKLEEDLKNTEDPEKRAKIEEKLAELKKAKKDTTTVAIVTVKTMDQLERELKEKLKTTEDPEKRAEIKKKLLELQKKKEMKKKEEAKKKAEAEKKKN